MRFAGTRALLVHQRVERVEVDGAAALLRDLAREVDREAERVVKEERVGPGDVTVAEDAVEQVEPTCQRLTEALLLTLHDRTHQLVLLHELRVRASHHVDGRVDERRRDQRSGRRAGTRGAPRGG